MDSNQGNLALVFEKLDNAKKYFLETIIDGEFLYDRLIIAYITGGHVLIEGVPGLAKTRAAKALSEIVGADFSRIQFTPDLLPSDITGNLVFIPVTGEFTVRKGPVFSGVVLADEINRASARVQSALLEAMEEKQVTIGESTHKLVDNFFVIATQNPIEHEGTYRLPEAQLDRFLMKLDLAYPSSDSELKILAMHDKEEKTFPKLGNKITQEDVAALSTAAENIMISNDIKKYIVDIVRETRKTNKYIEFGASPRASIGIMKCARIKALLEKRKFVTPDDVKQVAPDILRHRIIRSFEAEAEGADSNIIVSTILGTVKTP
ncbi:MAG: AAA family ATPase [Spirochaetaceae bacterium]|nr:AAA family ATPase [Spirochaetaceae bacterium]